MIYVALLRGINVGGKNRVEMARLKQAFEAIGCSQVVTYINSGNVIFSDQRKPAELKVLIEQAIAKEFVLDVPVVLRDQANIANLCAKIPAAWTNDSDQRTDVLFLWDDIDNKSIIEKVVHKPDIERLLYLPGALVWNVDRQHVMRGSTAKLIANVLYKSMTIRNVNTLRKLDALMSGLKT